MLTIIEIRSYNHDLPKPLNKKRELYIGNGEVPNEIMF